MLSKVEDNVSLAVAREVPRVVHERRRIAESVQLIERECIDVVVPRQLLLEYFERRAEICLCIVCILQHFPTRELVCRAQRSCLLPLEDDAHIDEPRSFLRKGQSASCAFLHQERNVEGVRIVACNVASFEEPIQCICKIGEARLIAHVVVCDAMNGSGVLWNRSAGIEKMRTLFGDARRPPIIVGRHFHQGDLDDPIRNDVGTRCFEIAEHERTCELQCHTTSKER